MKISESKEIISAVINNSTWVSSSNGTVFTFKNGKELFIDGKNKLNYTLRTVGRNVVLDLDSGKNYFIDFINDFVLSLYNDNEKFIITPE